MKECTNVTAWTDYPFKQLGDVPNSLAPIGRVEVLHYDDNKYATVRIGDMIAAIKCGYLYRIPCRLPTSTKWYRKLRVSVRKLERMKK